MGRDSRIRRPRSGRGSTGRRACSPAAPPQLPTDHRGIEQVLLDLLRDETLRQGWPVTDPVLVQWLGRLKGSSAAAKTARLLLG